MFESHAVENHAVQSLKTESEAHLYDGAYVQLDIRWHHNPIFLCEKDGEHFRIAGYYYAGDGRPLKAHVPTPTIAAIVPNR